MADWGSPLICHILIDNYEKYKVFHIPSLHLTGCGVFTHGLIQKIRIIKTIFLMILLMPIVNHILWQTANYFLKKRGHPDQVPLG